MLQHFRYMIGDFVLEQRFMPQPTDGTDGTDQKGDTFLSVSSVSSMVLNVVVVAARPRCDSTESQRAQRVAARESSLLSEHCRERQCKDRNLTLSSRLSV